MSFFGRLPWKNFREILKNPGKPALLRALHPNYEKVREHAKVTHYQKAGEPAKGVLKPSETFLKPVSGYIMFSGDCGAASIKFAPRPRFNIMVVRGFSFKIYMRRARAARKAKAMENG